MNSKLFALFLLFVVIASSGYLLFSRLAKKEIVGQKEADTGSGIELEKSPAGSEENISEEAVAREIEGLQQDIEEILSGLE